MIEMSAEARFFYDNAGYGYNPLNETAEQGRVHCAEALARAEARRKLEGGWVSWEDEPDPFDDDAHGPDEYGYHAVLWQYDAEADRPVSLGSLGMVDAGPGDPYRRVVEAELALEVWSD